MRASPGSHRDRLKWIRAHRARGRELVVGSSGSDGHVKSVGHVAADNTLAFLLTHLREAARRGGGDLIQVAVGINNSRRSADNNRNPLAFTVVNNTIFSLKGP